MTNPASLKVFNHGLYGSTSCCISHGPCQWERAIFDSIAPRPLGRFSWNLKYITTSRTRLRVQNFRDLCQRGWSGQIASLTHESLCPFLPFLSHAHMSHFWTHPNAQYVIKTKLLTPILAVVFVSLGKVVTQYRFGGWKNFTFTRHKFLLVIVKKWLKSVMNYRSYPQNKTGYPFFGPPCISVLH